MLRRLRFIGAEIAELLSMALSTVSSILNLIGMGKLGCLGLEPVRRSSVGAPASSSTSTSCSSGASRAAWSSASGRQQSHFYRIFIDGEGYGGYVGWYFVHIAIDDCRGLG